MVQRHYAALDSAVLFPIFEEIKKRFMGLKIPINEAEIVQASNEKGGYSRLASINMKQTNEASCLPTSTLESKSISPSNHPSFWNVWCIHFL